MADDLPPCTLDRSDAGPTMCPCDGRVGCQFEAGADVCLACGEPGCWGECENQCPCGEDCGGYSTRPIADARVDVRLGIL